MKELDVLLESFARGGLPEVRDCELEDLNQMLEATDSELLAWLMGATPAPTPATQVLADRIRAAAVRTDSQSGG